MTYNIHTLWTVLHWIPSYVEVHVTFHGRDMHLMARDLPKIGRRFTNLTTGTEWFIPEEMPEEVTAIAIDGMASR